MILTALGLALLTQLPVDGTYVADAPASRCCSRRLGMGAVFMPMTLVVSTVLANDDQGLSSGLFNTSQQIGGALGLAILSTIAAGRTAAFAGPSHAAALVHGFHYAYAGAAVFVLAALVVMLVRLRARDVARIEAEASAKPAFANAT